MKNLNTNMDRNLSMIKSNNQYLVDTERKSDKLNDAQESKLSIDDFCEQNFFMDYVSQSV